MAWRIAGLLWALVAVWLIDQLSVLIDLLVFMPYQVSILRSAVFAALYGTLLAAILFAVQSGPVTRRAAFSGWRAWLFTFMALQVAAILLAMLLGYESLARFIGTHIVSTAGVLWIMYLLHLMAEDISSVSVISGAPIDDDLEEEEDMGAPSLLTIRIIVSLLLDITIIAVGITILLLLWRFDWVEVKGWIQAAFFGFQFGNFRISLQSVLIALGVFAPGLLLTRFVQRWFTGRVFTGRRSDSGLHELARIGIGYLGFVAGRPRRHLLSRRRLLQSRHHRRRAVRRYRLRPAEHLQQLRLGHSFFWSSGPSRSATTSRSAARRARSRRSACARPKSRPFTASR